MNVPKNKTTGWIYVGNGKMCANGYHVMRKNKKKTEN